MARRFCDHPAALNRLRMQLRGAHPTLHLRVEERCVVIAGTFRIVHDGREIDGYKIEVQLPEHHPHGLPTVCEIGGRIPRHADHHINKDGSLCLGVPEELHLAGCAHDVVGFLDGPVRSFLLGHAYFVQEGRWPGGEWAHGGAGIRQFYAAIAGTTVQRVAKMLVTAALAPIEAINFDARCFCGSTLQLRACHGPVVQRLRFFVPADALQSSLLGLSQP